MVNTIIALTFQFSNFSKKTFSQKIGLFHSHSLTYEKYDTPAMLPLPMKLETLEINQL